MKLVACLLLAAAVASAQPQHLVVVEIVEAVAGEKAGSFDLRARIHGENQLLRCASGTCPSVKAGNYNARWTPRNQESVGKPEITVTFPAADGKTLSRLYTEEGPWQP